MKFFIIALLASVFTSLFGFEIQHCLIRDAAKHQSNQQILHAVIENELALCSAKETPVGKAHCLSARIREIADALLKNGFSADAYRLPRLRRHSFVSFNEFTLWEGEQNGGVPLTFFVYVWPSEEWALKCSTDPRNQYYASNIHSHPIPCAFAVLQGTFAQKNYERISPKDRTVRLIDEDVFQCGEGAVDDLETPFIHQLCGRSGDVCLTLHAYGLSSAKKVMDCFRKTSAEHSYH